MLRGGNLKNGVAGGPGRWPRFAPFCGANLGNDITIPLSGFLLPNCTVVTASQRCIPHSFFVPHGLHRFQPSRQTHFVTFTCYHLRPGFDTSAPRDLFVEVLESTRRRFALRVYRFVVMPEHIHILLSEPDQTLLANAIHYLKLSFTKRLESQGNHSGAFWQKALLRPEHTR